MVVDVALAMPRRDGRWLMRLRALDDRCRHRSTSLAGGRIDADVTLQRPYHDVLVTIP
jgi:phenylpropionate dioxygenase-like ring-hydroxylating dioxygenase large terminal subunit